MRTKRRIKPTKIFDNSVIATNKNSNKQKNESKKKNKISVNMNETVEYDGEKDQMDSTEEKENGDSMGAREEVMGDEHDDQLEDRVDVVVHSTISENINDIENDSASELRNMDENVKKCDDNTKTSENDSQNSYANKLAKNIIKGGNQLFSAPTGINRKGDTPQPELRVKLRPKIVTSKPLLFMASDDSNLDTEYTLSRILERGTVAEYQNEFEMLISRVTGKFDSLLASIYIFRLKLTLQRALLWLNPTTLGEAFSFARIARPRYETAITQLLPNPMTSHRDAFNNILENNFP
ncbi:hypothetical protein Tco_1168411 [Tanacetum coccineum]